MLGKKTAALLLASLAGVAVSGCVGSDDLILDDTLLGMVGLGVEENRFYAVGHQGGDLRLESQGGRAVVDLYDATDQRLGRLQIGTDDGGGSFSDAVTLPDVPAGELVLWLDTVGQGIRVLSGGQKAMLHPLPVHDERIIVVERDSDGLPLNSGILPGENDFYDLVQVELARAPNHLEVLTTGTYQDLEVKIRGAGGLVYEAQESTGLDPLYFPPQGSFWPVQGHFIPENVRSGALEVEIQAQDLQGDLVLWARSYSRAAIPAGAAYDITDVTDGFTYGILPERPVSFQVSPAAKNILLRAEAPEAEPEGEGEAYPTGGSGGSGGGNGAAEQAEHEGAAYDASAWATLFDPADRFLGTFRVPAGHAVAIPVKDAGEYVAVAHRGDIYLGADAVPVDFEMHPLEVTKVVGPQEPAGADGEYGIASTTMEAQGILFAVRPVPVGASDGPYMPPHGIDCYDHGNIRVIQGDTIGGWGHHTAQQVLEANLRLTPGPVDIVYEDWGESNCPREGIELQGYVRPGAPGHA